MERWVFLIAAVDTCNPDRLTSSYFRESFDPVNPGKASAMDQISLFEGGARLDFPIALRDAGQFYWGRPESWVENKRLFDRHSAPVVIPRWYVQDIDSEDDWRCAELMYQLVNKELDT